MKPEAEPEMQFSVMIFFTANIFPYADSNSKLIHNYDIFPT